MGNRPSEIVTVPRTYPLQLIPRYSSEIRVKAIRGLNADTFEPAEFNKLLNGFFKVTGRMDRMGCCLESSSLMVSMTPAVSPSYPVVPGTIQVLPSGNLVVLLNDAQATGGYPQIAVVAAAELWKLGQAVPGDRVCFEETDVFEAQRLLKRRRKEVSEWSLKNEVRLAFRTGKSRFDISINYAKSGEVDENV